VPICVSDPMRRSALSNGEHPGNGGGADSAEANQRYSSSMSGSNIEREWARAKLYQTL
jgi:hypothetical protein